MTDPAGISVRPAQGDDVDSIVEFNRRLALETEDIVLERSTLERGVSALLEDTDRGRYFIALNPAGERLGQLMITYEWSDWRNGMLWWLQSVYVIPAARRQGVFSALFDEVRRQASADAVVCGIRLYVEDRNRHARDTYQACGFTNAGYLVMEWMKPGEGT